VNFSRFNLAEYDEAMERFLRSPTNAGQVAAARKMSELARNYIPRCPTIYRLENGYVQTLASGLQPAGISDLLEVCGHRCHQAAAGWEQRLRLLDKFRRSDLLMEVLAARWPKIRAGDKTYDPWVIIHSPTSPTSPTSEVIKNTSIYDDNTSIGVRVSVDPANPKCSFVF
jgi:hypothetical protein